MPATFEDFIGLAAKNLQRATLAVSDGARVSSATCTALSAVTRSLITLSMRYGIAPNGRPATAWQPVFTERLTATDRHLRQHSQSAVRLSTVDESISDAARFVTIAQDLVATHLATPDGLRQFARTPTGVELLDISVREHLLCRAAEVAGHLADLTRTAAVFDDLVRERPHLADAYRPRDRDLAQAAQELAAAAAYLPEPTTAHLDLPTAAVLATAVTYPQPAEGPVLAAEQVRNALERLATAAYQAAHRLNIGEQPPVHTAGDLGQSATSLTVAHVLAADLLARLTPHLPSDPDADFVEAVDRLRAAGAAWARLRQPWIRTVSVPDSGPRSPLTVQADTVAIRLGRLLYADPAWTPQRGPGAPRALSDLLAPDTLDALCVMISVLPGAAATIATNHNRLVTDQVIDLYSDNRAHRPEGEAHRFYPLQQAQRTELTDGYQAAARASQAAASNLARLSRGYRALRVAELMRARNPVASFGYGETLQAHRPQQRPVTNRSISPQP